jgi:hypothetical protein
MSILSGVLLVKRWRATSRKIPLHMLEESHFAQEWPPMITGVGV